MTAVNDDLDLRVIPAVTTKFVTKKFVMKALIDKAMVVLPTRDIGQGQVLKNFQIEVTGGHHPRLRVAATDLDLWALASTGMVDVTGKGATLVLPGAMLAEITDAANEDDLTIDVDAGLAKITVKPTTWELRLPDGSKYPTFPDVSAIEFHSVSRGPFVEALTVVRPAATSEAQRSNLQMVDINGGRMRCSDGARYQQVRLKDWPKNFDLSIPTSAVDVLLKLLKTTESPSLDIGQTDDQIVFRLGGDIFVASKLVVEFPNVDERLLKPTEANKETLVVDRIALRQAIKRVRITSDPETSAVALALSPGKLSVRSKDKNGNTCTEELDVEWAGKGERTLGFNHRHLRDMIGSVNTPTVTFKLGTDTKTKRSALRMEDADSGTIGVLSQQRPDFVR